MFTKLLAFGWQTTQANADHIACFIEDIKTGKFEEERLEDGYFNFIGLFRFDQRGSSWVVRGPLDEEDKVVSESWLASVMAMTDLMAKMGTGMRDAADAADAANKATERDDWTSRN